MNTFHNLASLCVIHSWCVLNSTKPCSQHVHILCRGVVLEALGQFEDALTDYRAVLAVQPQDPAGWNNLGNASAGLGRWRDAADFYGKAASLAPEFAFSAANKAVAMFQLGETNESMREMRCVQLPCAWLCLGCQVELAGCCLGVAMTSWTLTLTLCILEALTVRKLCWNRCN